MTFSPLPRRTLLQSGAVLAGPLVLAGVWPRSGHAAPPVTAEPAEPPLSGTLAGWVTVEPDSGATVRLMQLDAASRPVRQAAELTFADSGASLQQVCQRAHDLALDAVARSWRVPKAECVASRGRIAHAGTQREIGYTLWVDIA